MSALKRLLSLALALLMLGLGGGALGETPPVVNYSDFLDSMTPQQAYDEYVDLLNLYLNNDPESAVDIEKLYSAFARVDYAYSFEFSLYTKVLYHLEQEDFTEATNWLIVLQINSDEFEKHLASEDFRLRYFNILDTETLSTYIEARREEAAHNASAAAILYERCLKFFDSMDRYTNNRVNPDVLVSLVQQQIADGDYAKAVENAQRLLDMGHHKAQALYAVASSKLQEFNTAVTVAPATTSPPIDAPTQNSSKAPAGWVWSNWQSSYPYGITAQNVESKTQYRSCSKTLQYRYSEQYIHQTYNEVYTGDGVLLSEEWQEGLWSDWSDTPATASSTLLVDTREVPIFDSNGKEIGSKTQYSTCPLTLYRRYLCWGPWSSWGSSLIVATNSRKVETRTVLGNWSAWRDQSIKADGDTEVETRKLYRYKIEK